jgi:methionyl-tRNA formyltransferase
VNWAIINGEEKTGNTMILLEEGVDDGDIVAQREIPIGLEDTCETIYDRVAETEVEMLDEVLPLICEGRMPRTKQEADLVTVMPRRRPEDGLIQWGWPALRIYNWIRALTHPYPGAFTWLSGRKVFVWRATLGAWAPPKLAPGEVIIADGRLFAGTGQGPLALDRLQMEGEEETSGAAFAHSHLETSRGLLTASPTGGAS